MPVLKLHNGISFSYCCASGALAYDGRGWWFEKPLVWLGLLDPKKMMIITKTLTFNSKVGNLKWYAPWRSVQKIRNGFVNCVGLTNPGYNWWINKIYPKIDPKRFIVSLFCESSKEAARMAMDFNRLNIAGIEYNFSCHNHDKDIPEQVECVETFINYSKHPVIVKLSAAMPVVDFCKLWDGRVDAFDLINSIPWGMLYSNDSPLLKYCNSPGAVSGEVIKAIAISVLKDVKESGVKTPIISGGGVSKKLDVISRFIMGAKAVSFGSIFIRKPLRPNKIIRDMEDGTWSFSSQEL